MDDSYFLKRLTIDGQIGTANGFLNVYTTLQHLKSTAVVTPDVIGPQIVAALARILDDRTFQHHRQVYFYYLQTAKILISTALQRPHLSIAGTAINVLQSALYGSEGSTRQAVADSLSHLPVAVKGPVIDRVIPRTIPRVDWRTVATAHRLEPSGPLTMFGRSAVTRLKAPYGSYRLVYKLLRPAESNRALIEEARWLTYFYRTAVDVPYRFDIPRLIRLQDRFLFRLKKLSVDTADIHPQRYAIAFLAPDSYFHYPNISGGTDTGNFREIMARNAWLLGRLSGIGIVHTAPIPLFHIRIQAHRRADRGVYEWFRAGRLDRWLASCDYPNIGPTGIRDFEHFISFNESSRELYGHLGNHLLGLLLVAGSYFRNKDRKQLGYSSSGEPADARHLFNPELFKHLVADIFENYYEGFTGQPPPQALPYDPDRLVTCLIEEMGIDRHMTEVLRVTDQNAMSSVEFSTFLHRHGIAEDNTPQGAGEISIASGPHLGGFNRAISVPELIAAVSSITSLCMLSRYQTALGRSPQVARATVH